MKIKLDKETLELVDKAFEHLCTPSKGGKPVRAEERVVAVLHILLEQWDLTQSELDGPEPDLPSLPNNIEEAMRSITEPNISLPLQVKHDKVTPRASDGLVPWEYILAGYSNIEFVSNVAKDYTNKGEQSLMLIRQLFTRIPEDQWESEQTKSIVMKAIAGGRPT